MSSAYGNRQKHESKNPIQRALIGRFHGELARVVRELGPADILDVGCGEGYVLGALREEGIRCPLHGIDFSADAIGPARSRVPDATFEVGDALALAEAGRRYDLVLMTEVLEHIPEPARMLPVLERIARPLRGHERPVGAVLPRAQLPARQARAGARQRPRAREPLGTARVPRAHGRTLQRPQRTARVSRGPWSRPSGVVSLQGPPVVDATALITGAYRARLASAKSWRILGPMLNVGRWSMQLVAGWEAELEEGCACVAKPDGVGVLLISHAEKDQAPVSRSELAQFAASELPGDADVGESRMGDFEGLHATYIAEGARWQRFYLGFGRLMLLISYTVPADDDGVEDDEVIAMLRTLRAKGNRWE